METLTTEVMWEATITCDADYDHSFIYAVKTTGVFCRPSCKSKTPNYENIVFFETSEGALKDGFRPCKRCKPDQLKVRYDSQVEIVEKALHRLEQSFTQPIRLGQLAREIGVSPFYFNRLFKSKTGCTPRIYIEKLRIRKAKEFLLTTNMTSTEICFQVGYESLSSFYKAFKRVTNSSPKAFRNRKTSEETIRLE